MKRMIFRPFLVTIIFIVVYYIPTARCQQARRTASNRSSSKTRQDHHSQHGSDRRREEEENDFERRRQKSESHKRHDTQHEDSSFWAEEETSSALAKILRKTKPRGLLHGIWKASQSTTLGFLIGMTCLITFPSTSLLLVGFQMKPILLATMLGGTIGLSAVAIGIWNGLYHCYWGLVQMPKSIQSWWKGSVWNPYDGGSWQVYNLLEHQRELMKEVMVQSESNYYQVLEVPATASKSDIKRAYYIKAKELHPDKNPGSEAAFLQLQKAYETLSDDSQRSWYDEMGHSSQDDKMVMMMFHPNLFFSILFDSNSLQPFVGNLAVSSWTLQLIQLGLFAGDHQQEPENAQENVQKLILMVADLQRKEQKRQVDVAMHLLATIQNFDDGGGNGWTDDLAFTQYCRQMAKAVVEKSLFQDTSLLKLVGERLELSARQWEKRPFGIVKRGWLYTTSSIGLMSHRVEFYKGLFGLLQFLLRHMNAIRQGDFSFMEAGQESDDDTGNNNNNKVFTEELGPKLWKLLWHYTSLDIQATIDGASWKLFSDSGANRKEQLKRAKALRIMGQEFVKVAKESRMMNHREDESAVASDEKDDEDHLSRSFVSFDDPAIRFEVAMVVAKDHQLGDNPIKVRKKVQRYMKQKEEEQKKKKKIKQ